MSAADDNHVVLPVHSFLLFSILLLFNTLNHFYVHHVGTREVFRGTAMKPQRVLRLHSTGHDRYQNKKHEMPHGNQIINP
jgi:hypothetical protein